MERTKEILKQVKKIEITTKRLVDGLVCGNYHSIFKGQGIEFSEIRDYKPGDDTRSIDWKVTARFNHPYIKEYNEERDLRVYFIFDNSGSGNFGNRINKKQKAIELTATLLFSALRNNDKVGLFIFTNDIETYIPARKGRRHGLKIISSLVSTEPISRETNIEKSLSHIMNIIKKRSTIFIISDFYSDNFAKSLSLLKNKHDVIALRIGEMRERTIPNIGLIQLEDEETGEQILVDTSDAKFKSNYEKIMKKQEKAITALFKRNKIDKVDITTDEPYEVPLRKFFKQRKRRVMDT